MVRSGNAVRKVGEFHADVSSRSSFQSRPFGVALLIAGVDEKGPQLWVWTFFA